MFNKKLQKASIFSAVLVFALFFALKHGYAANGVDSSVLQVKTFNNPTVYYLDHARGLKKAYVNEASYLSYGNKWSHLKIVDEAILANWPEVRLVKSANNSTVYYIYNNKKTAILSAADFVNYGFKWSEIVVINEIDLSQYQTVANKDLGLITTGLSIGEIKLGADSPGSKRLPTSTNNNLVAVFEFGGQAEINKIKSITLSVKGAYNDAVVKGVYLTDANGERISAEKKIQDRKITFNLGGNPIVVNQNKAFTIKAYVNMNDCANCQNNNLWIEIEKSEDIDSDKPFTGVFPIKSNTMSVVYATPYIGRLASEEKAINEREAIVGMNNQLVGQFTISELSDKDNVVIKSIKFKNNGTAKDVDLKNFKLIGDRGKLLATVKSMDSNREVVFSLNNFILKKKSSYKLTITCDVVDGHERTINMDLSEMAAEGESINFNISSDNSNISEVIKIQRKYLGVTSKELSASRRVFGEQSGVIIGVFEVRNNNTTVYLEGLDFSLERSGAAPRLQKYVYVVDYDTGKTLYIIDADDFYKGSVRVEISPYELKNKKSLNIALVADMPEDFRSGEYYQINFRNIYYRGENDRYYTDIMNVGGTKLVFSKSSVYAYPNNEEGSLLYVKGQQKIKVASFILEGAAGENVIIESMTFGKVSDTGAISYDNGFSNMYIKIGNKSSRIIEKPFSGTNTFDGINYKLRAGGRVEVKVYVNTVRELSVSDMQLKLLNLVAKSDESNSPSFVANLDTVSNKALFGEVSAKMEMVSGGTVNSGEMDNTIAVFSIDNTGIEDIKIDSILLSTSNDGITYSHGYQNLEVYANDRRIARISEPVAGANKLDFRGFRIKPCEKIEFRILVDAGENPPRGEFDVYVSNVSAQGAISKIKFNVDGDPTSNAKVLVQ